MDGGTLATLQRILGTARGGRAFRPPGAVRLKPFTAPDGSATAFVPDLPGWQFSGGGGNINGANATQGVFSFGLPFIVDEPGSFFIDGTKPVFPFTDGAGALLNVLPQYFKLCCNANFTNVQITGVFAKDTLGPAYLSGYYSASFQLAGRRWQGIFNIGTSNPSPELNAYYVYMSYIAVPVGGDARIGPALINTWASWNPGADQRRRLNQAVNSILTTNIGGGPIDPKVFDEAAAKWGAYIRGDFAGGGGNNDPDRPQGAASSDRLPLPGSRAIERNLAVAARRPR